MVFGDHPGVNTRTQRSLVSDEVINISTARTTTQKVIRREIEALDTAPPKKVARQQRELTRLWMQARNRHGNALSYFRCILKPQTFNFMQTQIRLSQCKLCYVA